MDATVANPPLEHERRLDLFGSQVRVLVGPPADDRLPEARVGAQVAESVLRLFQTRLSRFDPDSDLSRLNRDPRDEVPVSPLLAQALDAGLWAAARSHGLVDPTLIGALESAGYAESRVGVVSASLRDALRDAPARKPALPREPSEWRQVSIAGPSVRRPPGVRFDLGGTAKGLAADICAQRLRGYSLFAVDAGGDVCIGGSSPRYRPVEVQHPLRATPAYRFLVTRGAVATSGLATRIWRSEQGFGHHLLDPSTGRPAWTGVIQATALAPSALEAETLAKAALLSGPEEGSRLLAASGGVLVLDDGEVVAVGPIDQAEEGAA